MPKFSRIFLISFFLACFLNNAGAQVNAVTFGKNRVQFKKLQWNYYQTDNFNVYFYSNGQELAKYVLQVAEKELTDITSLVWSIHFPSAKQLNMSHLNKHEIEFIKKSLKSPKLNKTNNVFCEMDLLNWKSYVIKKKYTYDDLPDNLRVRIYFKDIYDEYMANQYERSEDVFDKYSNILKDIKI
jgi:hypothetical protein